MTIKSSQNMKEFEEVYISDASAEFMAKSMTQHSVTCYLSRVNANSQFNYIAVQRCNFL